MNPVIALFTYLIYYAHSALCIKLKIIQSFNNANNQLII